MNEEDAYVLCEVWCRIVLNVVASLAYGKNGKICGKGMSVAWRCCATGSVEVTRMSSQLQISHHGILARLTLSGDQKAGD